MKTLSSRLPERGLPKADRRSPKACSTPPNSWPKYGASTASATRTSRPSSAVTKASIHYHFPSKTDLGLALIERYGVIFGAALEAIERQTDDTGEKLRRYVRLYDSVMCSERMCLCGMLAAEYTTLPEAMQRELRRFFDANEVWLAAVLERGVARQSSHFANVSRAGANGARRIGRRDAGCAHLR